MNETQNTVSFLKARMIQGALIFVGGLAFLPPLWALFYLNITAEIYKFVSSFFQTVGIALNPYPKSFATAAMIALVLAVRSATWGGISLRFTLVASFVSSFVMEAGTRFLMFFDVQGLSRSGFGEEYFIAWCSSWILAGLCFYLLVAFCGLHERYLAEERENMRAAFWSALVYVIYVPVIFTLVTLKVAYGDELALAVARGPVTGRLEMVSVVMAALLGYFITMRMRKYGWISGLSLFVLPFVVCFIFYLLYLFALSGSDRAVLWQTYAKIYFFIALIIGLLTSILLRLLGVQGEQNPRSTRLLSGFKKKGRYHWQFGMLVFFAIVVIAPPVWQCANILLRALLFGLPPASFFIASISLAYFHAGLIYGALCAAYAFLNGRLDFPVMFGAAIAASMTGAFFPGSYLGISFGFFGDFIAWPMLAYSVVAIACWYILSCMKQIRHL